MPPQPGVFPVTHNITHKVRAGPVAEVATVTTLHYEPVAGPSSRPHGVQGDDPKKDKRRKEVIGKMSKEMSDRREELTHYYTETVSDLSSLSIQLSTRPETSDAYKLRLYPITLERGYILSSAGYQERQSLHIVQAIYDEERDQVEEEWKRGRERIRERLLEGIEERRRRAREEKDGEGIVADGGGDPQSRPHITRKLRNKMGGTSPPPTPVPGGHPGLGNGAIGGISSGPVTTGPLLNPHSLSVDELPSPFPLPLISGYSGNSQAHGTSAGGGGNGRRRAKGSGQAQAPALGKSYTVFHPLKETEYDADMGEIRRGNKRRRAAAGSLAGKA